MAVNSIEEYNDFCKTLREECNKQVEDGELTQEEADFRYMMVRDEPLWFGEDWLI